MHDPFGRPVRLPGDFSRSGRIALLGSFVDKMERREWPTNEEIGFVCGGIGAMLRGEGDLTRDLWRISAPKGSHHTPDVVHAKLMAEERQGDGNERE